MIVADTDFLSSFLKIGKLQLIFKALKTKSIVITKAVLHELEQAPMHGAFLEALHSQENTIIIQEVENTLSEELGKGELESITLAKKTNALLLMDDRKAAQFAKQQGIIVISIPTFLLHCKTNNILSKEELKNIITELKQKDFYEFHKQIKQKLME